MILTGQRKKNCIQNLFSFIYWIVWCKTYNELDYFALVSEFWL